MSDGCIFCKIVSGQIPSEFLYEDDFCVGVKDINPKATTHLLLISKKHISAISEMTEDDRETVGNMIFAAKKIADKFNLKGYKLIFNVGKDGGQEIFHIHLHLLSETKI